MEVREQNLTQRLEVILGELECHFHYLLNDACIDKKHKLKESPMVVGKLDFVAHCVSAAVRTMREKPVATLIELVDEQV
jgi:hypothetical protein